MGEKFVLLVFFIFFGVLGFGVGLSHKELCFWGKGRERGLGVRGIE